MRERERGCIAKHFNDIESIGSEQTNDIFFRNDTKINKEKCLKSGILPYFFGTQEQIRS